MEDAPGREAMAGFCWDAQAAGLREKLFGASASRGSIVLSSGCSHPLPGCSENKEKVSLRSPELTPDCCE